MRQLLTGSGHRLRAVRVAAVALLAFACGGETADTPDAAADAVPSAAVAVRTVSIGEPADGSTVAGPQVTVTLSVSGLTIVMAGDTTPATGHHHLFLDRDVSAAGQPIPAEPGHIVHMGDGSSSYTFESVAPGEHVLIAVVGDGLHLPLEPLVVDTVRFTVR